MTVDRSRLPVPGHPKPFAFPKIEKSTLPNGLRVWTVRHAQVPLLSFALLIRRGSADDPHGKDGLAALTADMLDEGSGDLSSIQMHEALARIGAQLETDIGSDAATVGVTSLSRHAGRAIDLLGDLVVRPALREEDVARVRQLRLHRLSQMRDVPSALADRAFIRLLYANHPYGHAPIGSERTLGALTADDVRMFHRQAVTPSSSTLMAVGDCEHDEVVRLAARAFGDWSGEAAVVETREPALPTPARLNIVPRAGAPQSELRIGHVAVSRSTPDYHAIVAANMVLGGQFVSRINLNLREDKGFTYGARTSFDFRRRPGPFLLQAGVQTSATAQAIEESLGEIAAIRGSRPVSDAELSLGVAALTRGYARNFETAEQIARALTQLALYDLPDDYYEQFVPRIEQVTPDTVTEAMARHLDPSRLTTVVVGDLDRVGQELSALGLGDPVTLAIDTL